MMACVSRTLCEFPCVCKKAACSGRRMRVYFRFRIDVDGCIWQCMGAGASVVINDTPMMP
jgi:hypothetical protein